MTDEALERSGRNRRWVEEVLDELLDEEGGESIDEQAFENAKKAARDLGAAVNEIEDPGRGSNQKIADLCGAAFEYGALFAGVQLNHDMRRELLRRRGHAGDEKCAERLEVFHVRHVETLADEVEDQIEIDRLGRLVKGALAKAKAAVRLTRMWS